MNSASPDSESSAPFQQTLLAALMSPQCYPHTAASIERIETHISTVLLTGSYAYKIKKPVDLGFLDFTTLALRRHFCEEELRLNRRLAPSLYLDVVAICGTPDRPRVCPRDTAGAIEYAVKMRQFEQQGLLDRMLARGDLAAQHVDALAATIAGFHATASRARVKDSFGRPAMQEAVVRQNFVQIRALQPSAEECRELDEIERWSDAQHAAVTPLMEQRQRNGYVRECHGDLHLGNIALVDGTIQVFDCIEFNADLRWTDVAAEIAFLVMDFAARGHPEFGARFLNAWLEISGDYEAVRLLPYYLAYRAMVRAKVACIRRHQSGLTAPQREAANAEFSAYLRLAKTFTQKRRPCLLITRGVSGSGKTTVTQPVLERLGALRLRSDLVRKRLHGMSAAARSDSAVGAGLYTRTATQATYNELHRLARLLIEAGWPVIVDATFLRKKQRDRFRALAAESDVPFLLLDCQAAPEELRRRVLQRSSAGTDASEATLAVLERQLETAEPLLTEECSNVVAVNTQHGDKIISTVEKLLSRFSEPN